MSPDLVSSDSVTLTVGTKFEVTVSDYYDAGTGFGPQGSVTATYTSVVADTLALVVDDLISQINAAGLQISVSDGGDTFTISRDTASYPDVHFTMSSLTNVSTSATGAV